MQLNQLKSISAQKKRKRVGRGGKKGTYSGRGVKGQKARAGTRKEPAIRPFIKKFPKLRGIHMYRSPKNIENISIEMLEKKFKEGEVVSPKILQEKSLISLRWGKLPTVKILGDGEIKKSLFFKNCQFSVVAREKIKKANGKIED